MADHNFWFNRVGKVAKATSPQGGTPNYGLTYDTATTPMAQDEFDELAAAMTAYAESHAASATATAGGLDALAPGSAPSGGLAGLAAATSAAYGGTPGQSDETNVADFEYDTDAAEDATLWDHVKSGAGTVGGGLAAAGGFGLRLFNPVAAARLEHEMNPDAPVGTGSIFEGGYKENQELLGAAVEETAQTPGFEQVFWGLEKANEGFSTVAVAATLTEDDMGVIFKGGTWSDAHQLYEDRDLNAGEAFVQMFYDKELILDEDRFEQVRQHNTVFNVGALAFNVTAAWKADPNVIFGKGLGAARDLSVGKLNASGRTAEVQREVLSAPDLDAAKVQAGTYSSLPDKLRATHAVSLYDRSLQLRGMAQQVKTGASFEDFKNLPAFKNSASGTVMAKLFVDVADDDDAWRLVFRSAIGDPDALGELALRQGEVSDKISAIEMKTMPMLERDLERVETRYKKRLAEQGRPQDARIEITRFGDRWLEDDFATRRADFDAASERLATYESHESWLQRALPGLDADTGQLDRYSPNAIHGTLDRLGGSGAVRRSLSSLGGSVKMWQHDEFSPRAWALRAPSKPSLKRVGVVSLNDVDEGASAITAYLDQMDYIQGGTRQNLRDDLLSRFAGATTDVERRLVTEQVEREGIKALGEKWGLSPEMMEKVGELLHKNRKKVWGEFSDESLYSPIPGKNGPGYVDYTDEAGNLTKIKLPVDPTQLADWHPLTNLTDLDRTIRQNLDDLRDIDADIATRTRAGAAWTERHVTEFVDDIGSKFNAFWKPLALLSIRWPMRMVADETTRVILVTGALPHLAQWTKAGGYALYNRGVARPHEWWNGRKVKTGSISEEALRPARSEFDQFDHRVAVNPTGSVPADALDFGKLDSGRYEHLNAKASERWQYLRRAEAHEANLRAGRIKAPLYHGSTSDLSAGLKPRGQVDNRNGHSVGDGFYATSNRTSAEEYVAEAEGARVYKIDAPSDEDVFDLDQPLAAEQRTKLLSDFDEYVAAAQVSDATKKKLQQVRREFAEGNKMSVANFKQAYEAATKRGFNLPVEGLEVTKWLSGHLEDVYGAKVLKRREGADIADEYIFLKPERLRVRPADEPDIPVPGWVTTWDDRLKSVEADGTRGFTFDPATNKVSRKGFAVSIYPGRMRSYAKKPTAREMNYWVEKNADVLATPNSRAAVWLDRDTNRWHLDAVKVPKRREDAMLLASRAEATEFYDIEDGFTRYLDEDFYQHFSSPFVRPAPEPGSPGGVLADFAPVRSQADEIGRAIAEGIETPSAPVRKQVGFGKKSWRTRDGRKVEGEDIYGPDTRNPNVYLSAVSSKSAIDAMYSGHARGIGKERSARQSSDRKMFSPDDGQGTVEEWASAYSYFVNHHVRYSPLWQRMMDGQADDDIYEWLMSSAKGRQARKRIGPRGENPAKWLDDERAIFDHLFPTERSLEAVRAGEVTPEQALEMFPEGTRPIVNGDTIKMALGTADSWKTWGGVVDKMMTYLGSMPIDSMVRHPYAANIYNREMRRYLSSVPADKVTNNVLAAAESAARAKAVRSVRRTLYNIADEYEGVHLLRFVSPFFQAQLEVLQRYARLSMEKPETVARLAQLLVGSQMLPTSFWQVTDREGNEVKGYDGENIVTFQVTPTMRSLADKLFLGSDPLKNAADITVPVSSLNMILQGENPFLPSMGPLVTYPANEFYFKDRPELEGEAVYRWMYPFGAPRGGNFAERAVNAAAPAYMRRMLAAETEDFDDSAFARRVSEIGQQQLLEWELGGREGPRPSADDALEGAKNEYRLRAASSFFLPAPVTPRSPYQFFIDQYREFQKKYGVDADEKFYDEFGPTYFQFAQQATRATGGMGPNVGEKKAYDRYKDLAERAPLLTGVLTGPFATTEFSDAVYQWQLNTRVSATSDKKLREHLDPAERIAESEVSRGWVEYGKLASAIEAEIRARAAAGGSSYITASSNADLKVVKDAKIREIIERNPSWQDAYLSRSATMGTWLGQAYDVAFDAKLDGRPDIEALRAYLISRARLQDALRQRQDAGISSSDQLSYDPLGNPIGDNADLAYGWQSYVSELTARSPLFAEVYNRYLEDDDLSTYISPEASGATP